MRKFYLLVLAALTVCFVTSCQDDFNPNYPADEVEYDGNRRILVAYFSQTGNTERLANQIVEARVPTCTVFSPPSRMPLIHTMTATVFRMNRITTSVRVWQTCPLMWMIMTLFLLVLPFGGIIRQW